MPPKRAIFIRCESANAHAARDQPSSFASTSSSCQWPTTIFRGRRRRAPMNPNSRSPWADWFRFMKSMSISPQGRSRLNCVCRWASGFCSRVNPAIHIFDGEKVCIQVITPAQAGDALASRQTFRIASGSVSVGFTTTRAASLPERSSDSAIAARVFGDLLQRLVAVEVLTAGQKPELVLAEINHRSLAVTRQSGQFAAPRTIPARGIRYRARRIGPPSPDRAGRFVRFPPTSPVAPPATSG